MFKTYLITLLTNKLWFNVITFSLFIVRVLFPYIKLNRKVNMLCDLKK